MPQDIQITPTEGMPPVTTETGENTTTNQRSGFEQTPGAAAAEALHQTAAEGVTTAEGALAPATAGVFNAKAQGQDLLQAQAEQAAAERQALIDRRAPQLTAAKNDADAAEQRYLNHKFYDWWSTQSTGDKVIAHIAMGLNAFANAGLGIPGNEVADKIDRAINRDFDMQKVALHSKEQMAKWKKEGVTDLYDQLQKELAALTMKQAMAHEAVAAKAEAMALRAGATEAEAKQNVVTAKSNEAAQKLREETQQRYEKRAESGNTNKTGVQTTSAKTAPPAPIFNAAGQSEGPGANKEQANKINEETSAAREAKQQLDILQRSFKEHPLGQDISNLPDIYRERVAAQNEIAALMPRLHGMTRLSEVDLKLFQDIAGGKFDAVTAQGGKRLEQLQKTLRNNIAAHLSSTGIKPTPERIDRMLDKATAEKNPAPTAAQPPTGPTEPPPFTPTPKDDANINLARARLKKNPNDKVAKDYLEAVGATP